MTAQKVSSYIILECLISILVFRVGKCGFISVIIPLNVKHSTVLNGISFVLVFQTPPSSFIYLCTLNRLLSNYVGESELSSEL